MTLHSDEHRLFLAVMRLASALSQQATDVLKPFGLSAAQFNVLRVLRGAGRTGGDGLACSEIAGRLITKGPDITRLLDRLEAQGLIERERDAEDRRVVTARITESGLRLLGSIDSPMAELHRSQFEHLDREEVASLTRVLEAAVPND